MSYSAYERDAGVSVIVSVEAHCRHLTDGGTFSATGTPVLARIEQWIDQAYFEIQAHLAKEGYSITVDAAQTAALGFLERLNVYGAVLQVELAHPITGRGGEENDRYKQYAKLYADGLTILASDALEQLGATKDEAVSKFVDIGGRSVARKDVAYQDTDAMQPRFRRGFGRDRRIPSADAGTAQ